MSRFSLILAVREPSGNARESAPLLVLLHGVGSNEQDLIGLAPALDSRFFVVSVRAPITLGHSSYGWYPVQFAPRVIHAMGEGPIRADCQYPKHRRHPIGKVIRRTWMSAKRPNNKEYNAFWAAQKAYVTFGNQTLRPGARVAYHNRPH